MKAKAPLVLLSALALLLAALWWRSSGTERDEITAAASGSSADDPGAVEADQRLRVPLAASEPERQPAAPAIEAAPATEAPPPLQRAEARLVDPAGLPLAGAELALVDMPDVKATSDADGRVTLALPETARDEYEFDASAKDRVRRRVVVAGSPVARDVFLGEIELAPAGVLSGRVVDESGAPVEKASVYACAPFDSSDAERRSMRAFGRMYWFGLGDGVRPQAESAADGTFRLEGVPALRVVVGAWRPAHLHAFSAEVMVVTGSEQAVGELVLEQPGECELVTGTLREADGRAVAGAEVRLLTEDENGYYSSRDVTGADGAFRLVVGPEGTYVVRATHEKGELRREARLVVRPCDRNIELVFAEERWFELAVVDARGEPIEGAWAGLTEGSGYRGLRAQVEKAEAGRLRVELPRTSFSLSVGAAGYRPLRQGPLEPDQVPPLQTITLERAAVVRGDVRAASRPLPGAAVHLHRKVRDSEAGRLAVDLFTTVDATVIVRGKTDDEGGFELPVIQAGTYCAHAEAPGLARGASVFFDFQQDHDVTNLVIELVPGGAIEGRVLTAPGVDPRGTLVVASSGDGHIVDTEVGQDGRFGFTDLTPGPWQVARAKRDERRSLEDQRTWPWDPSRPVPWNATVLSGQTATCDLDLRDEIPSLLRGRVLLGGAAPQGWSAWSMEASTQPLDAEGRFVLRFPKAGSVALWLGRFAAGRETRVQARLELEPGENVWELDLPVGRLEIDGLPAVTPPEGREFTAPAFVLVRAVTDGVAWSTRVFSTPGGRLRFEQVPAGRLFLARAVDRGIGDPAGWPRLAEFDLAAGEDRLVTIVE